MTTRSITHVPLMVGSGMALAAGRGLAWVVNRIMLAPMASAVFFIASGLTLMAMANALFLQDGRHPAPMFVDAAMQTSGTSAPPPVPPVVSQPPERPAELASARPEPQPQPVPNQPAHVSSGSVDEGGVSSSSGEETRSVGNREIAELQEKLREMGLFDGTVDGFYGPKTADAIRAFEARFNMPRTGAASSEVIEAVREAPLNTSAPAAPARSRETPEYGGEIAALIAASDAPQPVETQETVAVAQADPVPTEQAVATASTRDIEPMQSESVQPALDRELVRAVQIGLSRLGFLHAPADGIVGDSTAQAIRKFQIFHNYPATGEVSAALLDKLAAAGADL